MNDSDVAKRAWVLSFIGANAEAGVTSPMEIAGEKSQISKKILDQLAIDLSGDRLEKMREDFTLTYELEGKTAVGRAADALIGRETIDTLDSRGDERNQLDVGHGDSIKRAVREQKTGDLKGTNYAEKTDEMNKHLDFLLEKSQEMLDQKAKDGSPVFTEDDVFQQLWEPLRRQRVVPDNVIPDRYSAIARHFQGAADLTEESLRDVKPQSQGDKAMELLGSGLNLGATMLISGAKIASAGMGASTGGESLDTAIKGIDTAAKSFKHLQSGTVKLATTGDVCGAMTDYNKALSEALTAAAGKDIATMVSQLIGKAIWAANISKSIETGNLEAIMKAFGGEIAPVFKGLDSDTSHGAYAALGIALQSAMVSAGAMAMKTQETAASSEPDRKAALTREALGQAMSALTSLIPNVLTQFANPDADGTLVATNVDQIDDASRKLLEESVKSIKEKGLNPVPDDVLKKVKEELEKRAEKNMEEQFTKAATEVDPLMKEALAMGFSSSDDDPEKYAEELIRKNHTMEQLIERIKRNQAIYDAARALVSGAGNLAALLAPGPGGVASSGVAFMLQLVEAGRQTQQFAVWLKSINEAEDSGSAVVHAIRNRYDLQKQHMLMADAEACFRAAELVGNTLAVVPDEKLYAASKVVVATSQASNAVLRVAYEEFTKSQMRSAWSSYRKALSYPEDRKEAMKALSKNPILAKYAVAYAALEENDPVARMAMQRCGIDEQTLANKDTSKQKVVEFLNTLYREDPKVLSKLPPLDDWHPGRVVLEAESFADFYRAAMKVKKLKLEKIPNVPKIVAAMSELSSANKKMDASVKDPNLQDLEERRLASQASMMAASDLSALLADSKAVRKDKPNEPAISFAAYLNMLKGMTKSARRRAEDVYDKTTAEIKALEQEIEKL
jgi:hypothetical protein